MMHRQFARSARQCVLGATGLLMAGAAAAQQGDSRQVEVASAGFGDLRVSAGLRLWESKWTTWFTDSKLNFVYNQNNNQVLSTSSERIITTDTSNSEWATIPTVSVRYRNFLVAGSHLVRKSYGGPSFPDGTKRSETDLNFGYYVLPGLALTVGYKNIEQEFRSSKFKWKGPAIGLAASAQMGSGWSLYGNVALARLDADFPVANFYDGKKDHKADYQLAEAGIAYTLSGGNLGFLKAATFTAGFRSQTVSTKGYALGITYYNGVFESEISREVLRRIDLKDTTQGITLGFVATF